MLTKKQVKLIHDLNKNYYKLSIGKKQLLKILSEVEVYEQVYNSNAIENSTLSIEETEKILLEIDLDRYVSEREIFEAKNLARLTEYISNNAENKNLDAEMILFLHKILISNINNDIAGRFRKDEFVRVGSHIAPAPAEIGKDLEKIFANYSASKEKNIVEKIAQFHLAFETLHPFIDGNGRIGRSVNNYLLIREGYVSINIRFDNREAYYAAFKDFQASGKTKKMEKIIFDALVNAFQKRIAYVKNLEIITLAEYARKNKLSLSNLINKAKRQTVPAFREKGLWKIGVEIDSGG